LRSRAAIKLLTLAALAVGTIALVLPATASAEALVFNQGQGLTCGFAFGGRAYLGSGASVVTPAGQFILSCHMSLVAGTPVTETTTTTVGLCEIVETPTGEAHASCHAVL
jgi:hypothetical protein